jgi:hypothetical protein
VREEIDAVVAPRRRCGRVARRCFGRSARGGFSRQADSRRGAVCGWRVGRSDGAAGRQWAHQGGRPERRDREPPWRWRQHRHRGGGARSARWLHAAGDAVRGDDQSVALRQGAVRSRRRSRSSIATP